MNWRNECMRFAGWREQEYAVDSRDDVAIQPDYPRVHNAGTMSTPKPTETKKNEAKPTQTEKTEPKP